MQMKNVKLETSINKMKQEGLYSQTFVNEFNNVKRQSEDTANSVKNLESRFQTIQTIISHLKTELVKQVQIGKNNQGKIASVSNTVQGLSDLIQKSKNMQLEVAKLAEENIALEGKVNLLSLEQSHMRTTDMGRSSIINFENKSLKPGGETSSSYSSYRTSSVSRNAFSELNNKI